MVENIEGLYPSDYFLKTDSIPSVWCPGCGIGTVVNTFIQTVEKLNIDLNNICVVSGVGCTGKIVEYLKFSSFNTIYGNVIEYAVNLKLEKPNLKMVVFSNNADFLVSGAKDFIENGKKSVDILVIHINNIIYTVTEHGVVPATPFVRIPIDKDFEFPFNVPHLAKSCGAKYVARWTPLRVGWLMYSIIDTFSIKGFSLIEVISPCLMYYANNDRMGDAVERMKFYNDNSVIKHGESTQNLDIRVNNKIIIGKFVERK